MKAVRLRGGLGNQLFTLAFAHSVAVLTGERVGLDVASFGTDAYGRDFILAPLAADLGCFEVVHRPLFNTRPVRLLGRLLPGPLYRAEGTAPADETGLRALVRGAAYFDGYWQNEIYIASSEAFRAAVRRLVAGQASPQPRRAVVIHYRTYKEERRPEARTVPGPDYFRQALANIEAAAGKVAEVALVSDDPGLALERLGDIGAPLQPVAGTSLWEDMALLMGARHLILSNSSFSWWGGFCGEADLIFYPLRRGMIHYAWPARRFTCL
jgi:hypothetical protein